MVGAGVTDEGRRRFAAACNTLHLIASKSAIEALHDLQAEMLNPSDSGGRKGRVLSRLLWEIRKDFEIPRNPPLDQFEARLMFSSDPQENE